MTYEYKTIREVEFSETDMAGIMHFARFFCWMEAIEHAFIASLGFAVHRQDDGLMEGWPRVDARCSYRGPLRYRDRVEIHLLVRKISTRSIVYDFIFRKLDESDRPAEEVARGALTVVHVQRADGADRMSAAPIDPALAAKLSEAPEEVLQENA